jgi:thiol:disulfide interchange protein
VDFTAAWCLSCQVNERVVLHTDAVQRAFAKGNVVLLRADWTSRNAEITKLLATFGRSGVPLYVMYPSAANAKAEVLSAVLTPGQVTDAVARATGAGASAGD